MKINHPSVKDLLEYLQTATDGEYDLDVIKTTTQNHEARLRAMMEEVIGEDEDLLNEKSFKLANENMRLVHHQHMAKNILRAEQRQKITKLLNEMVGEDDDTIANPSTGAKDIHAIWRNNFRAELRQRIDQVIKENFGGRDE